MIKWFDRRFDFDSQQNIFPSIMERLVGTPLRLYAKTLGLNEDQANHKPEGAWSIKEQVGHLSDLEGLWQGRLEDILSGAEYLRSWDLENKQTTNANHNSLSLSELLFNFEGLRKETVDKLRGVNESQIYKSALHPRLNQPMRMMDLFLFVAEHDDHHLAVIEVIKNQSR